MKRAHFIGICGAGMGAVAKLLKDQGWEVSGSDSDFYPPVSTYLEHLGILFHRGYKKENIPPDAELIVIGKHARLVPEENDEVKAALRSGIPVRSYPAVLEDLIGDARAIVVAGSCGKSTVTGLIAWCLLKASMNPGFFIGAVPAGMDVSSALGDGSLWILEGDEYPSSNFDPTPKFLHYRPHSVLVTAADHDHLNVFPTLEDYLRPFQMLIKLVPSDGLVVGCLDNVNVERILKETKGRIVTYGLENPSSLWTARNIRYADLTSFELFHGKELVARLDTPLLGRHNVQNIVGAAAMLLELKSLSIPELARATRSFRGIKRRLDKLTERSSVLLYEGFGSSYHKARASIEAMRLHFPSRRLIIVFEPHAFSWRNHAALEWYDTVFSGAELVFIYSPPSHGQDTHDQLSHNEIIDRALRAGVNAIPVGDSQEIRSLLQQKLNPGDVLLVLTSGNLGGALDWLPVFVEETFPQET